jgi:hypothetical protein
MHDDDIRPGMPTPAQEDEIMQRSALTQVLVLHPAQLTTLELPSLLEAAGKLRPMIATMAGAGLRNSETCGLTGPTSIRPAGR